MILRKDGKVIPTNDIEIVAVWSKYYNENNMVIPHIGYAAIIAAAHYELLRRMNIDKVTSDVGDWRDGDISISTNTREFTDKPTEVDYVIAVYRLKNKHRKIAYLTKKYPDLCSKPGRKVMISKPVTTNIGDIAVYG